MDVVIEIDDIQRFDRAYLRQVKRAGVRRIAAAIDDVDSNPGNPNPDSFVPPTERDIFLDDLEEVGLLFEAQTHLTATNVGWLDQIAASLEKRRVSRWLVSVCVRQPFALPTRSVEKAIQKLAKIASRVPFPIATRHAPLFLRLCHEAGGTGRIEDERHGIYIDNDGRIYPDPSVELSLGNIRERSLIDIIRNHPVLRALRQPESIEGKCGVCVFNNRCGGSRVRAFNLRGSLFASDPSCEFVGLEERHDELTPHRL
jgi:radical SAM protein with 4Fe4S-binding SPASM domain